MTAPRAAWKGFLKVDSVSCGVKIVGAVTESEKVHFRVLGRKSGAPVKSAYVDDETGDLVDTEDQVKGYEVEGGSLIEIDPADIKKLKLKSQHTLEVEGFVPLASIDARYLEKPYYLVPADAASAEAFSVIRDAMAAKKVAARSCVVLYQRGREVLIQPLGRGMLMTELRTRDEMISEKSAFKGIKEQSYDPELEEIAGLLIDKKKATFDPSKFEDRYEKALIALIEAKRKGKKPPKPSAPPKKTNVVDLASVLKKSLQEEGIDAPAKKAKKRA